MTVMNEIYSVECHFALEVIKKLFFYDREELDFQSIFALIFASLKKEKPELVLLVFELDY